MRYWIPPLGLGFGQLSHAASWTLAIWIGLRTNVGSLSLPELAWVHLVALGWLTMTALSILLHLIPSFLDVRWRYQGIARAALAIFAVAMVAFVAAFLWAPTSLFSVALVVAVALTIYLATAWSTLWPAFQAQDRIDRAVARAFAATLSLFFIAILLGLGSATLFLPRSATPPWFTNLPPTHAAIAVFGWVTLLIYGVSARTLGPITGNRSRRPVLHVIYGSATLVGALLLAAGTATVFPLPSFAGAALIGAGAAAYVADVVPLLRRSTVTYRPPQCFVAAALVWLIVALCCGAGVLGGLPWYSAFGFAMLAGWAGQMVNGHIFHIGVRLVATIFRGDDDETPPSELLDRHLPWLAFGLMQIAIGSIAGGLIGRCGVAVSLGAVFGLTGWIAMLCALLKACAQARRTAAA